MVVCTCNPSTWEAEAGGSQFLGQSVLHSETELKKIKPKPKPNLTKPNFPCTSKSEGSHVIQNSGEISILHYPLTELSYILGGWGIRGRWPTIMGLSKDITSSSPFTSLPPPIAVSLTLAGLVSREQLWKPGSSQSLMIRMPGKPLFPCTQLPSYLTNV